ncbi:MAG TPA: hypothetical protein VHC41_01370 [Mycobacteriales bacterium]|nr:hypothetical protein [Mycobacteriales bacterium]
MTTTSKLPTMNELLDMTKEQLQGLPAVQGTDWVEMTAEYRDMKSKLPEPGPCPSWCALPAGHPYELRGLDGDPAFYRHHSPALSPEVRGWIEQQERNQDGVVTLSRPVIRLDCGGVPTGVDLTGQTATWWSEDLAELGKAMLEVERAEAANSTAPPVRHLPWCDPQRCYEDDSELGYWIHRSAEEPISMNKWNAVIQLVRSSDEPTAVVLDDTWLTPEEARRLASTLTRFAETAEADPATGAG